MFGNNNGYQPVSMIEPSYPHYEQPQPKKRKPIFIIVVVIVCVLTFIFAVVAVVIGKSSGKTASEDYSALAPDGPTDSTGEPDKLNPRLAALVENDPHVNYQTKSKLIDWSSKAIYGSIRGMIDDNSFNDEYIEANFKNVTKVEAMNANIINYYLDRGKLVAISAKGDFPFSEKGQTIIIFGSIPEDRYFYITRYETFNAGGAAADDTLASYDLFAALESNEKFYVIGD